MDPVDRRDGTSLDASRTMSKTYIPQPVGSMACLVEDLQWMSNEDRSGWKRLRLTLNLDILHASREYHRVRQQRWQVQWKTDQDPWRRLHNEIYIYDSLLTKHGLVLDPHGINKRLHQNCDLHGMSSQRSQDQESMHYAFKQYAETMWTHVISVYV